MDRRRRGSLVGLLMTAAYRLSRAETYTPVSYWMGLSMRDLRRWLDVVAAEQRRTKD